MPNQVETEVKWMIFRDIPTDKKTRRVEVISKRHESLLGMIKWYGPWRQYSFFPEDGCIFNKECMYHICNQVERMQKDHFAVNDPEQW